MEVEYKSRVHRAEGGGPAPIAASLLVLMTVGCGSDAERGESREALEAGERPVMVAAPTAEPAARPSEAGEPETSAVDPLGTHTPEERLAMGAVVFLNNCASCHQGEGEGIEGEVPPLAGSDFLNADKTRAITVVAHGLDGEVVVNGHEFASRMPSLGLSDDDIANVLTYVFSQWGNSGQVVTADEVHAVRE